MSQEREASPPTKKTAAGSFIGCSAVARATESSPASRALDLEDIQGIIVRGYRMPIVRHFLLKVDVARVGPQAPRAAGQRRRNRRAPDHDGQGLARRIRAGPRRRSGGAPAPQARLLPEPGHHLAGIAGAGGQGSRPRLLLQVVQRVRRRGGRAGGTWSATRETMGRQNWIGGFGDGKRSRHADAACREARRPSKTYSDRLSALLVEGRAFQEIWRQRRHGTDGDAGREAGARLQGPLRLRRWHQHDDDSRRSRSATSPITSSRASPGYSSCTTRPRITSCPSRQNWAAMEVSPSSR